jgi:trans-aconitate methyltransferase
MPPYAQDAKRLSLLFDYGVATDREVIQWADSQIVALDSPPDALIQLAVTRPTDTAAIISHLHTLSAEAEFWPAFRAALGRLHDHVVSRPADAERIANDIYLTVLMFPDVPAEFYFAYRFDDAFSLARDGTFGDEETVRREFIHELQRFTPAA